MSDISGEEIDKPSTYSNGFYHYDINGWTKSGNSYVASFTKTPYIGNDIYFNYVGETLKVDAGLSHLNEVNLSYLFLKMGDGELNICPLRLIFNDGEVNLTSTQVKYLVMRHAATIGIEFLYIILKLLDFLVLCVYLVRAKLIQYTLG